MSRREKLFSRLDELEAQFRKLLEEELETAISKGQSPYLDCKRQNRAPYLNHEVLRVEEVESVETEIQSLREKLAENPKESWVSVADELCARGVDGSDSWFGFGKIPKAVVGKILDYVRQSASVSAAKDGIRTLLTTQRGVTGYKFSKEALTKGLAYPIKRQSLDMAIIESAVSEVEYVTYRRKPWSSSRRLRAGRGSPKEGFREGELFLNAYFRVWNARPSISLSLYAIPNQVTAGLKPHIGRVVMPTLRDWMAQTRTADHEWKSIPRSLEFGWYLNELQVIKE